MKNKIISNFEMVQRIKAQPKPSYIVKTGMPTLDSVIDGFRPGELIIVTGFTKCGKTLWCKTLTKKMHDNEQFPLWFTFEETPEQFLSGFPNMSEGLVFFMPNELVYNDIDWLTRMIDEGIEKFNTKCIFIDHLHFLFDMGAMKNSSLVIGSYIRKIKRYAIEKGITIFLVCHTTKGKIESEDDISYTSIRDSSFIAQESDCVLFVHRKTTSDGIVRSTEAFVKVEFHRRTGAYGEVIRLQKKGNYLEEIANYNTLKEEKQCGNHKKESHTQSAT